MTSAEAKELAWKGIFFAAQGQMKVLVFECYTPERAEKLLTALKTNKLKLTVGITLATHQYKFRLEFLDTPHFFDYESKMTKQDFPQIEWLSQSLVTHLGVCVVDSENNIVLLRDFCPLPPNQLFLN